jgi:hypothetical protein
VVVPMAWNLEISNIRETTSPSWTIFWRFPKDELFVQKQAR